MSVLEDLRSREAEYAKWRHEFHRHPELGLEEVWTSGVR